jgi:hypothetical protein
MNDEHQALLQNSTWHVVPPPCGKNVTIVSGYIRSNERQLVKLIATRLDWLPKVIGNNMALIMMIHLV